MDSVGLYWKYRVNRPLSTNELDDYLARDVETSDMPWHGLDVIRMNSTYLEMVDKFYPEKGYGPLIFGISLFIASILPFPLIDGWARTEPFDRWDILISLNALIIIAMGFWFFQREIRYTHYPIRFNRKNRKVYVFRRDGTVMTEDWDKLFFTTGPHGRVGKEIRGHRISEERQTWERWLTACDDEHVVLETFALPFWQTPNSPYLRTQWEFVRRYMERPEELDALVGQVDVVMPVGDRRESFLHGFKRHLTLGGGGLPSILMSPFFFVMAIFRWIVMHVARRPKWPQEVEDACRIDPNDPWQIDAPPRGNNATVWNYATNAPHDGKEPDYVAYGKRRDASIAE